MRKLMITATLGCLTLATAADAHRGRGPAPCAYINADRILAIEIAARVEPRIGGALGLA